jgi:acetate kinase
VNVLNLCVTWAHVLYVGRGNIRLLCRRVSSKTFSTACSIAAIGIRVAHGVHHYAHPSCMEKAANAKRRTI